MMNRRRFLGVSGLGALAAFFSSASRAVANTVESCVATLEQIRYIALGPGTAQDKLDQIVALVNGEIGPPIPTISGDFAGTIPAGETWRIVGDVNLTGDMIVEGTLTSVDTFTLEGNGHQIVVQNGGRLDLAGKPKTGWVRWGAPVSGWEIGDQLIATRNAKDTSQHPSPSTVWGGTWNNTDRPSTAETVTLVDGSTIEPEVINLSQTARINNVSRIMIHGPVGVQRLDSVQVSDSGTHNTLDHYPIHFHHCGDSTRGSTVTDVVVYNSAHRAFVPHDSHGITFTRCVATFIKDDGFWWNHGDSSNDITYDTCLVHRIRHRTSAGTISGFWLGLGSGNRCVDCVVSDMWASATDFAFTWENDRTGSWEFRNGTYHNGNVVGLWHYQWNNPVQGFTAYRTERKAAATLAVYRVSGTTFSDLVLTDNEVGLEAKSVIQDSDELLYERIVSDSPLVIGRSQATASAFAVVRDCSFPSVYVNGENGANPHRGKLLYRFEDCGLTPADFTFNYDGGPLSVFSIVENGVEIHRYANRDWSF